LRLLLTIPFLVSLTACGAAVNQDHAIDAMKTAGWSEVTVTGKNIVAPDLMGCSEDDAVVFYTKGKNPAGQTAEAKVCCGAVFKSCTIRY